MVAEHCNTAQGEDVEYFKRRMILIFDIRLAMLISQSKGFDDENCGGVFMTIVVHI